MKAYRQERERRRIARRLFAGVALLIVTLTGIDCQSMRAAEVRELRRPEAGPVLRVGGLPFTAEDVAQYFSTVLEMSAEKGKAGGLVFENQQATHPEDRWRIEVRTEHDSVLVEFRVGGDYGLTLAREFFESPLFERDESEQLYGMLGHAQNGPLLKLRRFAVEMMFKETVNEQILLLKFLPLNSV